VEQILRLGYETNGSLEGTIDQIALTGASAIRMLPDTSPGQLTFARVDELFAHAVSHGLVIYWTMLNGDSADWALPEVIAIANKYKQWLVLDAQVEPDHDDPVLWLSDSLAAVSYMRGLGYEHPLLLMTTMFGRNLPNLINQGATVAAADPLGRTMFGWQAYWGDSGFYQGEYGMTIAEGVAAAAQQTFPIQVGFDHFTDGVEVADWSSGMAVAEANNVGWLWWHWYSSFWSDNNLTLDGQYTNLDQVFGEAVVHTDLNGIENTAIKVCNPGVP
jgi:hypothetical protein